jgi:hypothetical protein
MLRSDPRWAQAKPDTTAILAHSLYLIIEFDTRGRPFVLPPLELVIDGRPVNPDGWFNFTNVEVRDKYQESARAVATAEPLIGGGGPIEVEVPTTDVCKVFKALHQCKATVAKQGCEPRQCKNRFHANKPRCHVHPDEQKYPTFIPRPRVP